MSEWSFEYPEALTLFLLFMICRHFCKKVPAPSYFPHLSFFGYVNPYFSLRKTLIYLIALTLTLAIASPIVIDHHNPGNRNGFDIALCIDSSGSMSESGFHTGEKELSKFESVKRVVGEFILGRRNDNISLVLFGDFAYIASPLTYEKEVLVEFMELQDMAMAGKNTAIGDGLARSIDALKDSRAKTQLIILLTDGKQNAGSVSIETAVAIAAKNGIRIYTVGVGEDADRALLELIATQTGGRSYEARDSDALEAVYDEIDALESSRIKSRDYAVKAYYFHYPAMAALLLLTLYLHLISRRIAA